MGDPPVTQVNLYKVMVAHDLDDLGYHNFRKPENLHILSGNLLHSCGIHTGCAYGLVGE